MVRLCISINDRDAHWLRDTARADGVAVATVVRRALRLLKENSPRGRNDLDTLIDQTAGVWKAGNALRFQQRIRREWLRAR